MAKKKNSRLVAADIIAQWLEDQSFPDRALAQLQHDHGFILEVVNGVIRNQNIFQWIETKWLKSQPQPFFRAVLQVGLYQLLFMNNVEEYAAINETVDAAKGRPHGPGNAKMINAVLRRAQREKTDLLAELEQQPAHIRLSHPLYLMKRWEKTYGQMDAEKLAAWNNKPAETILRILQSEVDPIVFMEALTEAGIEAETHPYSDKEMFLTLPRGVSVRSVPGYDEGWFTIQDPATSVACDLLAPRPMEDVLDACAAPGGKTGILAARMDGGLGKLVAMDKHDDRIDVLEENKIRLKLDGIEIVKGDARYPEQTFGDRKFDAILLDVPCLNTGVLRRRADARWRVDDERMEEITRLQLGILDACSKMLKERGRMVYSTCSLEPEENEELVMRWVRNNPEFRLGKMEKAFPPESGTDGAFAALIRKK